MKISRRFLALTLFVCLFSLDGNAQSCTTVVRMPTYLKVEHPSCRGPNEEWRVCDPGVPLHFTSPVVNDHPEQPFCQPFTWQFDGGSDDTTTTLPAVDRALSAGTRRITAHTPNAGWSYVWVDVYYGLFSIGPEDPALGNIEYIAVREDHGPFTVEIRRDDARFASTVEYAVSDDSDRPAVVPASGTFTFEPGDFVKTIVVELVDDDVYRGSKSKAKITLSKPTNDYGRYYSPLPIYLTEDDSPTIHRFGASHYAFNEAAGAASIEIVRTGNIAVESIARIRFPYNSPSPIYVPFNRNEDRKTVVFDLQNDFYTGTLNTTFECSSIVGTTVPPTPWLNFSDVYVPVTITDDEPVTTMSFEAVAVTESDADQTINIPLRFSPPRGSSSNLIISARHLTTSDGDFGIPQWSFVVPAIAREISIPVRILGDERVEGNETFQLTAETGDWKASTVITIQDDDAPAVQYAFDATSYVAQESAGSLAVAIHRTGDTTGASDVVLHVVPTDGLPWPVAAMPVHFSAGDSSAAVDIPLADGWYTGTRNARLELRIDLAVTAWSVLEVEDAEPQPVLSVEDVSIDEGWRGESHPMYFHATLSGAAGVPLTFRVHDEKVTASDSDYRLWSWGTHTLAPGQLSVRLRVEIIGDWDQESDETFLIHLSECCGAMATLGPPATGTIRDDDAAPISRFTLAPNLPSYVDESLRQLAVTIRRDGDTTVEAAAVLRLIEPSGANGHTPVALSFGKGEIEKTVELGVDDRFYNWNAVTMSPYRFVTVEIEHHGRTHDSAQLWLSDDELPPVVSFGKAAAMESLTGSQLRFRMSIDPPWAYPFSVTARTLSGTAISGKDFDGAETSWTVPPGASELVIPVVVLDDGVIEPDETFAFTPVVKGIYSNFSVLRTTGTIVDNDGDHPSLLPEHVKTSAGAAVDFVVDMGNVTAEPRRIVLRSSDPGVVAVPADATVAAGQRTTSTTAHAVGRGSASVLAVLPNDLILESQVDVDDPIFLSVAPASLTINAGTSHALAISLDPSSPQEVSVRVESSDGGIASAQTIVMVPAHGTAEVSVKGVSVGRADIEVSLPVELGGARVVVPIEVVAEPAKRRGVRH